jgi:hypothetical protein
VTPARRPINLAGHGMSSQGGLTISSGSTRPRESAPTPHARFDGADRLDVLADQLLLATKSNAVRLAVRAPEFVLIPLTTRPAVLRIWIGVFNWSPAEGEYRSE